MRLFLATGNPHKAGEVAAILAARGLAVDVRPAGDLGGMPAVEEDAGTFAGNARKKALALAARLPAGAGAYALADDSGLCVEALGGAPGVHSARFSGPGADDAANRARLLERMTGAPPARRAAAFHCAIVVASRDGAVCAFAGRCEGRLLDAPRGSGGFGYDPLFVPDGFDETFAELPPETKNRISHRARALAHVAAWLEERLAGGHP